MPPAAPNRRGAYRSFEGTGVYHYAQASTRHTFVHDARRAREHLLPGPAPAVACGTDPRARVGLFYYCLYYCVQTASAAVCRRWSSSACGIGSEVLKTSAAPR